jgi:heme o synthase
MLAKINSYIQLTKPSIMLLVLFTGTASLAMEGSFTSQPGKFLLVLLGLFFAGGSANALNQYFERDIDAEMSRTAKRRPLPLAQISPQAALTFSVGIGVAGVLIFALFFNWLTAMLALGTILFYSLYYTLWLKPRTIQNIVIGGVAGAMAPIGAWTAATGHMAFAPVILFAIIFLWTPPHFWALALRLKDDYGQAGVPMLPVTHGPAATRKQIPIYSVVLVAFSFILVPAAGLGLVYGASAVGLGAFFIYRAWELWRRPSTVSPIELYKYSLLYLALLFVAMGVDVAVF